MKITSEILKEAKKLYLEGNSIRKVTKLLQERFGIKVGKTTVEYHLKKVIKLRNKKEVMTMKRGTFLDESEIARLYAEKKLSLKQIAKMFNASPSGIKWILLKNGIKLREKREGLILRKGKYRKPPFKGTPEEKAYLIGITLGDLHVRWNSNFTIEVNTSTTHEAMKDLLVNTFSKYTDGIVWYPDEKKGFRFYAYLDKSFDFLITMKKNVNLIKNFSDEEFLAFLAGFFDAEGSIVKRRWKNGLRHEIKIGNTNKEVLEIIKNKLDELGINSKIYTYKSRKGKFHYLCGRKIINRKDYHILEVVRNESILNLLKMLKLRHEEKIERKRQAILN